MAVNYDDVIKQNKRNLTRAQIQALAKAANKYSAENAGNRADALASLRNQYDTGYRGLQNMGLAGGLEAQATSGEVPRLKGGIQDAFDKYNATLSNVEHQRLTALGTKYANATKRARAEAYAKQQAEQAARAAAEQAQVAYDTSSQFARDEKLAIKRAEQQAQREARAQETAARQAQERAQMAYDASSTYARNEKMAIKRAEQASDRAFRAEMQARQAQLTAAAQTLGVSIAPKQSQQAQVAQSAANLKAAEERAGQDNGELTGRTKGPSVKTQTQLDARQEVKRAEESLRQNKVVGYDTVADKRAYEEADARYKQAEQAMQSIKAKPGSTVNAKRTQAVGMTDSDSDTRNEYQTAAEKAVVQEFRLAQQEREAAKLKYEQPKLYAAYVVAEDPDASPDAREAAAKELMKSWGYEPDERSAEKFEEDKKTVAKYAAYLAQYDDAETPETKQAAEATLKSMGVTPDEARRFVSEHRQARAANGEYEYYRNALMNQLTYAGKAPTQPVNQDEQDPLYRAVNKLEGGKKTDYSNANYSDEASDEDIDWANANFAEQLPEPDVTTGEEYVAQELRYLTDDERNAYNYIYETQGLQAANQYIRDGMPIRNIRAAAEDQAYAEKLVQDSPIASNLLSIASGTLANVPAMAEKLVKGTYNYMTGNNNQIFIDTNDATHRMADIGNKIQSETSRRILENNPGVSGKIYNFAYQTGMSMAQSAAAMAFAANGAPWAVDVMFFSSAGNEAYKDAIERGGTQEQAMAYGVMSGVAEALFEKLSIENFLKLDYQGKGRVIRNVLEQAGVEASEEVNTELANILSDALTMKDKSQLNLDIKKYQEQGMSEVEARNQAVKDQMKNIGMAGLGGLASGLGFGVFGALPNTVSQVKTGKEAKAKGYVDSYIRNAELLGGDAAQLAKEVSDSYTVDTKGDKLKKSEPSNRLVGALAQQVNREIMDIAGESAEKGAAVQTLLTGEKLTTNGAKSVMDALGAETLEEMGYDTSSSSALAKSYNARLQEFNVTPKMQETSEARQIAYDYAARLSAKTAEFAGKALEQKQSWSNEEQNKATSARANAANQVWANPTQGMQLTAEGRTVPAMPGNMTAISFAEQERNNFQTRASAKTGNVTYAVAGMQTREGLSNEQTLSEIKKGLTKEARQKAEVYEKLSSALGIPMVIHDVMTGTNGFIDEDGNMHVVLSGKQSVLRVAAHELTHWGKNKNAAAYSALREHLINEVGDERFDRMLKQKAKEYGIDLSTEKGKALADDEVCAELCERMLSNEDALEKFAMKNTEAAKSLKDHLVKILNAIKQAFKQASNREFGDSWSDLIQSQDTIESWITMLQGAVDKAEARAQTNEGQIGVVAGVTESEQEAMLDDIHEVTETAKEEVKAEKKQAAAEVKAERDPLKARRYVSVTSTSNRSQGRSFEGGKAPKGMTNLSYKIDNAESFGRKLVTGSMSDYANFGYSSYFGNLDGDAYGYSKNTWRSDNGRAIMDSQAAVSSAADLKQGDAFLDDVVRMNFLSSEELGNAGSMEESDVANRAPVELPALTQEQKQAAADVAKMLAKGKQVVLQLPVSDNFDGEARATLQAVFEAMPATKRTGISFATGLTAADIAKAVDVNLIITDESQNVSKDGRQVVKMPSMQDELFMDEETERRQDAKKAAQETAKKKTYVRGYTAAEVDKVLAAGVLGDKSNYEGNDYEEARGMIAQLIPDVVAALKGEADVFEVNDKIKTAVGAMLDNYIEDNGDMTALRKAIPPQIGVDTTAKSDLKHQDLSLFQMSAKLSKALGRKTTIVGPTNAQYNITEKLEDLWPKIRDQFGLGEKEDFSVDLPKFLSYVEREANTRKQGEGVFGPHMQDEIDAIAADIVDAVSEMYGEKTGVAYSLDTDTIRENPDIRYSLDTDAAREAFTHIDTTALENGLESLKNVTPGKGVWALKDISRFMDSVSGGSKELRDNLTKIFETPHRQALKNYATGVGEMQRKVLDIGQRAGVCDAKGNHFDSKKSAAIQNIGEGFSNKRTDVTVRVVDSDAVRVTATDKETGKPLGTKDYTFRELRGAYGREVADQLWSDAFDAAQKEGKHVDVEREVNTQPYTLQDLKEAYPQDWQKLKAAADEFRTMYDDYIRNINGMLETIYPYASKYATVDKITEAIEKKQQRLADRKAAYNIQIENLQKSLEEKEKEIASKKRTDTKAYRQLVEQANRLNTQIADAKAEIAEYEANIKDELTVMGEEKALMMNAEREGDSLGRMHRLEYRSDYFHHFTEMASGIQNLKSIFTGNTDISPAVVGKSDQTKPKSRFAGFFQQRQGGDYTADALNGMLRYGQLAEYKLAFDPFAAYLRDVEKQVTNLDKNATNRDNLIRYIQQWTNTILGKSHTLDRALVDSGVGMRSKLFKTLNWINSRVIQNTLLWNMRSALIQISNVTNAKGIVTNNLDWANGLRKWALARRGNSEMQSIMNQSTFLASRYMDNLELTESKLKSAKQFAGWLLGALDEVSAKATWWAAYTQYQRNPNAAVIKNAYRTYDNAIDYADDVTRRTHAGRGVGELAPAMTSRVLNLVAPFQVEVNNTYQLMKDNVKQKNYMGLLSTGLSIFALNTVFEAIVGATPLGFDFIRAIVDIAFGIAGDDPDDDDDDYSVGKAAQRLAGEFVGGLPYANQIVGLIGKDNAEKIIGSDTDVTRYGNTQIGLNALMNTVAGISDIGSAVKEGKNLFTQTNFISDIDDLLNIIMPMGGKQLTRTAEGLITMAKGYGGKVDKEGNEKVQFVADNDIVNWLHAGLFGKWSLTQASEYFGEERLLPKLFGAYEGPKSATGQLVDAKQYKAALKTGIDGKDFFTLKSDMKGYTTQAGKRAEMMQQSFTPEQKAQLDALMIASKDAEMKTDGAVVYQKSGDDWKVKADYTNQDMFDLSQAGDKAYTGTLEVMDKTYLPQDQAVIAADMWDVAKKADDSKATFRELLRDNKNLTVEQKEALDLQYTGNKYPADYSDPDLYELSTTNRDLYDKAKEAKSKGVPVKTYTGLYEKKKAHEGDGQAAYMRSEIMNSNLTVKQKELLDDMLVSDKGRNPDYSSKTWFEISMVSESQYEKAKEGTKVGVKPETYLAAYKKRKELNAKDKDGKYIYTRKEARTMFKEYLDKLTITAPAYEYLWAILK